MDFEFRADDFSKLMFLVGDMPENIDPVKKFPKLLKYKEFLDTKMPVARKNKIFRYIVFMYDRESPFTPRVPDLHKRKIEVAKYVKLVVDPKTVPEDIKRILRNDDTQVNEMIIAYCRMQNNPQYSLVVGLTEKYYNELLAVMNKDAGKSINISTTMDELQRATGKLLAQDNSPQLTKELFEYIEEQRIDDLRPEGIAEIFSQGKKPFDGEDVDYNPED